MSIEISLLCRRLSMLNKTQYWEAVNLSIYSPATLQDELNAIELYRHRVESVLANRESMVKKMIDDLGKDNDLEY